MITAGSAVFSAPQRLTSLVSLRMEKETGETDLTCLGYCVCTVVPGGMCTAYCCLLSNLHVLCTCRPKKPSSSQGEKNDTLAAKLKKYLNQQPLISITFSVISY